ncbi:unnamed protein product, partial [marine sediment metagenome]
MLRKSGADLLMLGHPTSVAVTLRPFLAVQNRVSFGFISSHGGRAMRSSPSTQHVRRNALAFIGESTWFGLGLVFASTTTLLPEFVSRLTGSAVLVGLIISLTEGAWRAPQLLFANRLANKSRKK